MWLLKVIVEYPVKNNIATLFQNHLSASIRTGPLMRRPIELAVLVGECGR